MDNKHESRTHSLSSLMYIFLFAFALITFLSACSLQEDKVKVVGSETWETTESIETIPTFLEDHTDHTTHLYGQVHEHYHTMSMIDCYCGCMVDNGIDEVHDSLMRCYITDYPADDGTVTFTDHSTTCGVCKQELELVIDMKNSGSTDDEVIAAIKSIYEVE